MIAKHSKTHMFQKKRFVHPNKLIHEHDRAHQKGAAVRANPTRLPDMLIVFWNSFIFHTWSIAADTSVFLREIQGYIPSGTFQ